jgi:hypothetical protein
MNQSVLMVECTIPADMTIDQWRRHRGSQPAPCDHFHETTSRYDHEQKVLTFLLVCPVCRTEKVVETQDYEPRFEPHATIHRLPVRRQEQQELPARRAA